MKKETKKLFKAMRYKYGRHWKKKFKIHKEFWFGRNSEPRIWIEKKPEEILN